MYIKIINSRKGKYYLLCVCDHKTNQWAENFITREQAAKLIEHLHLKSKAYNYN